MKRRRLLQSSALIAGGTTLTIGTGAFTSVSAQRTVEVAVADDEDAYLSLEDTSNLGRSFSSGSPADQIAFSIPGVTEGDETQGDGVGQNSTYEFGGILEVTNQGDDTVVVWSKSSFSPPIESLALTSASAVLDSKEDGIELGPGDAFSAGLLVETGDGTGEFSATIKIRAEESNFTGRVDSEPESIPGPTDGLVGY